jgi:hypothetical protein
MNVSAPLEKGDHPEIDTSDFLDAAGIQQIPIPDRPTTMGYISGEIRYHHSNHEYIQF